MTDAAAGRVVLRAEHDYSPLVDPGVALEDHPAVLAWHRLSGSSGTPGRVESLKPRTRPNRYKSYVYRLLGGGPGGADVVAKLTLSPQASREHAVYQHVLPALGIPSIASHGMLPSVYPGLTWLFLEDAGRSRYEPSDPRHRSKAAAWLARLHVASGAGPRPRLLDLEAPDYRRRLRDLADQLTAAASVLALSPADRRAVERIIASAAQLERDWAEVSASYAQLPTVLVHGDFKARNLLVWEERPGAPIVPVDWTEAHWGPMVIDLHGVEVDAYRREAGTHARYTTDDLEDLKSLSVLLRTIDSIGWEIPRLLRGSRERALRRLRMYEPRLRQGALR